MESFDVAIIGAGIIGSSIAFELASGDATPNLRILLLDRQQPAREASWAAAGMLSPTPETADDLPLVPLAKESLRLYNEFITRIEDASGRSTAFARAGTLHVFLASHADSERDAFLAQQARLGIAAEPVAVEAALRMEPALGPVARAVAWLPDEATVDPRLLSEAAVVAAARRGVEIRSGVAVSAIARDGNRCAGVVANGEHIAAKHVVLAAGAFSHELLQPRDSQNASASDEESQNDSLARLAPTHPVRGQMLALRSASVRLQRVLRSHRGYIVPRPDGRIIAGSTLEDAGFEKRVTPAGLHQILTAALELAPALAGAEVIETWSGLRPGTPDGLPIIGALGDPIEGSSGFDGLLVATGHYRNGILLAPVTAKLIARWIARGSVEPALVARVGLQNFSPRRFARAKKAATIS